MMHIAYSLYFSKKKLFPPYFDLFTFLASPTLTMMHLRIIPDTYWVLLGALVWLTRSVQVVWYFLCLFGVNRLEQVVPIAPLADILSLDITTK